MFDTAFNGCRLLEGFSSELDFLAVDAEGCSPDGGTAAVATEPGAQAAPEEARSEVGFLRDAGRRVAWLTSASLILLVAISALAYAWWTIVRTLDVWRALAVGFLFAVFLGSWFVVWQPTLGEPPRLAIGVPESWVAVRIVHLHLTADFLFQLDPEFHRFAYRLYMLCFGLLVAAVIAVIFAASCLLLPFENDVAGAKVQLGRRMQETRRLLYVGSLLLTVGIIFTGIWLRWPSTLLPADGSMAKELASLAESVTLFWGAVYTALLLATYVPGALCLRARARALARRALGAVDAAPLPEPAEEDVEAYLQSNRLMLPFTDQLQRLLAIFAPAMVGPLLSAVTALNQLPG